MAIPGIPLIKAGDDLKAIIQKALENAKITLHEDDVLVISSKIVSKAEDRLVKLDTIIPGQQARSVADETGKDPRLVELILKESTEISRKARGVLVTRHRLGFVSANAGIDQSNIGPQAQSYALLLPVDPDTSAQTLHQHLQTQTGLRIVNISLKTITIPSAMSFLVASP